MKRSFILPCIFIALISVGVLAFMQPKIAEVEICQPGKKCCEHKCNKNMDDGKENILHNPINHFIV